MLADDEFGDEGKRKRDGTMTHTIVLLLRMVDDGTTMFDSNKEEQEEENEEKQTHFDAAVGRSISHFHFLVNH